MFFRRFAPGVLAEPGLRGTVAVFAAYTFGDFERATALLRRGVKRVARQTLWRLFRFRAEFQDAGHPFAEFANERLVRARVFVLENPCGVFVLKNAAFYNGFHAAVACSRSARTWPDVFRFDF